MEDLFAVIMAVLAIVSAIMKSKKKAEKIRKKTAAPNQPTLEQSLAEWFNASPQEQSVRPKVEVEKQEAAQNAGTAALAQPNIPEEKQVAQPRVKARVEVREKPTAVTGSLGEDTHEGLHPCDEHEDEPLQDAAPLLPVPVEEPGIRLEWSGENMVRAFIMQEVLTRPCDRRRRA